MSTRSRTAFVVVILAVAIPFFVLWIRTMMQSWSETRTMPLVGKEDRERYDQTVQETKKTLGDFKNIWDQVTTPPQVEGTSDAVVKTPASTSEPISTEALNSDEQQLQAAVDQSK